MRGSFMVIFGHHVAVIVRSTGKDNNRKTPPVVGPVVDIAGDDAVAPMLIHGGETLWKEGTVSIIPWTQIADIATHI